MNDVRKLVGVGAVAAALLLVLIPYFIFPTAEQRGIFCWQVSNGQALAQMRRCTFMARLEVACAALLAVTGLLVCREQRAQALRLLSVMLAAFGGLAILVATPKEYRFGLSGAGPPMSNLLMPTTILTEPALRLVGGLVVVAAAWLAAVSLWGRGDEDTAPPPPPPRQRAWAGREVLAGLAALGLLIGPRTFCRPDPGWWTGLYGGAFENAAGWIVPSFIPALAGLLLLTGLLALAAREAGAQRAIQLVRAALALAVLANPFYLAGVRPWHVPAQYLAATFPTLTLLSALIFGLSVFQARQVAAANPPPASAELIP